MWFGTFDTRESQRDIRFKDQVACFLKQAAGSIVFCDGEDCFAPSLIAIDSTGEQAYAAYKTLRDSAIFTFKRLIVRDAQGITGKKVENYSIPYSSIMMWSTEEAGRFDFNAEVELWTRAGNLKIKLGKKIDVRRLDYLIATCLLAPN